MIFVLLLLGIIIPGFLMFMAAGHLDPLSFFALTMGAIAFSMMALNLFLATRPAGIEKWAGGLDRLYQKHKWMGIGILVFMIAHESVDIQVEGLGVSRTIQEFAKDVAELIYPAFLALIVISFIKIIPKQILDYLPLPKPRFLSNFLAKISFQIPYHWWRLSHKVIGVLFIVIAFHQYFIKLPYDNNALISMYLNSMAILGILSFLYTQFVMPNARKRYEITSVDLHPAATLIEAKPLGRPLKPAPGQFATISIKRPGLTEPHPFTISGSLDSGSLQFSIRGLGDYTRFLRDAVRVGDIMYVKGPYGRFDYRKGEQQQVWVAGGIGITPFLAFADSLEADEKRQILLVYAVNKPEEAVGMERLMAAQDRAPGFRVELYVSSERGRFNAEKLIEIADFPIHQAGLWFCGPAPMRIALLDGLKAKKEKPRSVHFEQFEFR